jgi:hypothetical protein
LQHFKPRIEDRTRALVRARLRGAGPERDVCILDASSRGFSATTVNPPRTGEIVELIVGNHSLVGRVRWSGERRFGVQLRERISVFALLSGDSEPLTLKQREVTRALRNRAADSAFTIGRKMELVAVFAAAVAATFIVADYASAALQSLDSVKQALGGRAG